ncbi:MAG: hypothetical protein R6X13_12515 [bacterium]
MQTHGADGDGAGRADEQRQGRAQHLGHHDGGTGNRGAGDQPDGTELRGGTRPG